MGSDGQEEVNRVDNDDDDVLFEFVFSFSIPERELPVARRGKTISTAAHTRLGCEISVQGHISS